MLRYLVLACFALLVGIASYLAEQMFFPPSLPFKRGSLEQNISNEFRRLLDQKLLPEPLFEIKQVFIADHRSEKTQLNWSKLSQLYFPQKPSGKFDLEIEIFDSESDEVPSSSLIILQMSLFDSISKNKFLELNHSYKISELKK